MFHGEHCFSRKFGVLQTFFVANFTKILMPLFYLFFRKNQYFFIFQVDLIGTPHDVSFRRSFIRSFGFFFLIYFA